MILMIDNYDSFTYNIVQEFGMLGADVRVVKNDEVTVEEIAAVTGQNASTLRVRLHRGRKKLKHILLERGVSCD